MVSTIDIAKPIQGSPTTDSVRTNFQRAYNEITALQNLTSTGPFLPLSGGTVSNFEVNDVLKVRSSTIDDPAWKFNLKIGTRDMASLSGNNVVLESWNGVGIGNQAVPGQRIPVGFQGINFNVRTGNIIVHGIAEFRSMQLNEVTRIGQARFFRDTNNAQNISLTTGYYTSLDPTTPIADGTVGNNVNDRYYDIYDNIYTVMSVDAPGGAVTSIRIDSSPRATAATFPNPITLMPCPGFPGTGIKVNLIATLCPKLLINVTGAGQTLEFACPAGINFVNNVTVTGTFTTTTGQIAGTNTTNGYVTINGMAGNTRALLWQTAGAPRWRWAMQVAEGTDTGSDLYLQRYNDAGVATTTVYFNRNTGNLTFNGSGMSFTGGLAASTTDLTKHINFLSGTWGINISAGRINFMGGAFWFVTTAGVDIGVVTPTGLNSMAIGQTTPAAATFSTVKVGTNATGPTWTTGTAVPSSTEPIGSLYSKTNGTVGATLYVRSTGSVWTPVAGV